MDTGRIATLLAPYLSAPEPRLLEQLGQYLDLLLRWNARTNLTSVREPDEIVTRHFGESLFAAGLLFGGNQAASSEATTLADVGSGAGVPGLPIKLFAPALGLTLIESQNKKATFLREVVRTLGLVDVEVFPGRAEKWGRSAHVVTLRAVEKFEKSLSVAADLVAPGGRLCLLIGAAQTSAAKMTTSHIRWQDAVSIPRSTKRVVMIGNKSV